MSDTANTERREAINRLKATLRIFSWDEVPGNDSIRLIEFLKQNYSIVWVKTAKIEKSDKGNAIKVSTEKNSLLLKLNDEKSKVSLKIDNGRSDEFVAYRENGKLNIYESSEPEIGAEAKERQNELYDKLWDIVNLHAGT